MWREDEFVFSGEQLALVFQFQHEKSNVTGDYKDNHYLTVLQRQCFHTENEIKTEYSALTQQSFQLLLTDIFCHRVLMWLQLLNQ